MTQTKQLFRTRGKGGLLPHTAADDASASTSLSANELQFCTGRGARLLVRPASDGVACRRQRTGQPRPLVFCSVTAAASGMPPPTSSGQKPRGRKGNGKGQGGSGEDGSVRDAAAPTLERLPVAIKKGDELLPYVWDGHRVSAMDEEALRDTDVNKGRLRNWLLGLQRRVHEAFLPDPRDVTPDYWDWLRWRLSQRFFSSTMQNFSFSALLMATGLGAKKAFAASAAINWLLKDGVSRIVRMSVSTSFGQTFDADLKRMRFITSLIFTACMVGEFSTPFWPQHFVALASVSSVGRAVGLSAFVATQPAFQAALATGGNLADLTSKTQAQHMVMDMMALGVSASLTWLCRAMPRGGLLLPAIMYPLCAAGDLTCIWHELKAVQLRTLNRERAEMVIERWIRRGGQIPDSAEISAAEKLIFASDIWQGCMPLQITSLERIAPYDPARLKRLLREYEGEQYVLHVTDNCSTSGSSTSGSHSSSSSSGSGSGSGQAAASTPGQNQSGSGGGGGGGGNGSGSGGGLLSWLPWGGGGNSEEAPRVLVSLSDRATPTDITKAVLHTAYLRKAVLDHLEQQHRTPHTKHRHHHHHHKQEQEHHHSHHHHHHHQQPQALANNNSSSSNSSSSSGSNSVGGSNHDRQEQQQQQDGQQHNHHHGNGNSSSSGGRGDGSSSSGSSTQQPAAAAHTASLCLSQARPSAAATVAAAGYGNGSGSSNSNSSGNGNGNGSSHSNSGGSSSGPAALPDSASSLAAAAPPPSSMATEQPQLPSLHPLLPLHPAAGPGVVGPAQWKGLHLDQATWAALIRSSHKEATRNLPRLLQQAEQAGWKMKPFMLNTTERVQYVRL